MSGHHIKNGDFLSDKYRIIRIDSLENLKKYKFGNKKLTAFGERRKMGYLQALEDIKKLSEEVSLNKIVLSFHDERARTAINVFANITKDFELKEDILKVLDNYKE